MIDTLVGPVEESELEIKTIEEQIPCGLAVKTQYFKEGQLVRQDVQIRIQ